MSQPIVIPSTAKDYIKRVKSQLKYRQGTQKSCSSLFRVGNVVIDADEQINLILSCRWNSKMDQFVYEVAPCDENGKPIGDYESQATGEKEQDLYPPWGGPNEDTDLPPDSTENAAGKKRKRSQATDILVAVRGNLNKDGENRYFLETPGQTIKLTLSFEDAGFKKDARVLKLLKLFMSSLTLNSMLEAGMSAASKKGSKKVSKRFGIGTDNGRSNGKVVDEVVKWENIGDETEVVLPSKTNESQPIIIITVPGDIKQYIEKKSTIRNSVNESDESDDDDDDEDDGEDNKKEKKAKHSTAKKQLKQFVSKI